MPKKTEKLDEIVNLCPECNKPMDGKHLVAITENGKVVGMACISKEMKDKFIRLFRDKGLLTTRMELDHESVGVRYKIEGEHLTIELFQDDYRRKGDLLIA